MADELLLDCPFKVGDRVRVTPNYRYHSEWDNAEYIITGIMLDKRGDLDIWINDNWPKYGCITGFAVADLELVNPRAADPCGDDALPTEEENEAACMIESYEALQTKFYQRADLLREAVKALKAEQQLRMYRKIAVPGHPDTMDAIKAVEEGTASFLERARAAGVGE